MRVRVSFNDTSLRVAGLSPSCVYDGPSGSYKAVDLARWHGAAMGLILEALKGVTDKVRRIQLLDQFDGHADAQAAWARAEKGGDGAKAVDASDEVLSGIGTGYSLDTALAASGGRGWPGRPDELRVTPVWSDAAKAILEG